MRTMHELASIMKDCLTSNGEASGKKCKKVYLVSECETKNFPFHFHLIPRFECEKTGNLFLFEKELEEARWMSKEDREEAKIQDGFGRVAEAEAILDYHRWLLLANRWIKSDDEWEKFISRMKKWWSEHRSSEVNSNKE